MKRIDVFKVELDGLGGLAVAELEDTQRRPPSNRITITEMSSQRLDRGGHELLERSGAGLGLRGFAGPAA
jgi:hypothetical protein